MEPDFSFGRTVAAGVGASVAPFVELIFDVDDQCSQKREVPNCPRVIRKAQDRWRAPSSLYYQSLTLISLVTEIAAVLQPPRPPE
jgi:hypothetical protein